MREAKRAGMKAVLQRRLHALLVHAAIARRADVAVWPPHVSRTAPRPCAPPSCRRLPPGGLRRPPAPSRAAPTSISSGSRRRCRPRRARAPCRRSRSATDRKRKCGVRKPAPPEALRLFRDPGKRFAHTHRRMRMGAPPHGRREAPAGSTRDQSLPASR